MTNPKPPTDDLPRVYRGGAWNITTATNVRAAPRYDYTPTNRSFFIGFRCALRGRQPLKVSLD